MDEILTSFFKDNFITIGMVLSLLKVIAIETPWAADDKIIEILTGIFKNKK